MRRPLLLIGTALLIATSSAGAPPPSAASHVSRAEGARESVAVTIYNSNLGLVRETRTVSLSAGFNELRYMDVAAQINPRTVHIASVPQSGRLDVREQNYEFDLISPEKLMERFIGRRVKLVFGEGSPQGAREQEGTLISTNGGMVYDIGGSIHVNPPARPVLPEIPGGLISVPTLVWLLEADSGGSQKVETSYLTGGLTWAADYVGVVEGDDAKLALTGWVTLDNTSGATYENATLKLVAGDVHRAPQDAMKVARAMEEMQAARPAFAEESFFEYHLYTLERPSTIKDRQTKQIQLLESPGIAVKKVYLLTGQPMYFRGMVPGTEASLRPEVQLELVNSEKNNLGMPLPAGIVRLYKKDASGSLQFIGEDRIDHTPKDETVRLQVGRAFDVTAERVQTDFRAVSAGRYDAETAFRISIRNHKTEDVTVIVREPVAGDWKVLSSSHPPIKVDATTLEFSVPVSRDKEAVLEYRIAVDWGN
ncbi:MAG: DUF4139 domain-containing protein [Candidatus Polarisedimenticolia bacterium]